MRNKMLEREIKAQGAKMKRVQTVIWIVCAAIVIAFGFAVVSVLSLLKGDANRLAPAMSEVQREEK